ncbi:MAG: DNA mismatch repair endonuclease MutL [Candidatus Marinimicrobia bacterium]|nr:DNA mismatch repair endonuclease MutL [Candidatus Neomarinimicrobiota bacterium]MCF7840211.1 DNA mismatch repair endonuclease MutL [Candidatus Neomarinimicrobiota bacterium]MCF7902383.1 DNA mismatch repair endonuclease MutL [Candidatus Neomarinimicrobiota bacterium]
MTTRIHILPEILTNKIAAGEVIQRPASVVKELMENAIDAGADKIDVTVEQGGRTLIQVTDNGQGMNGEELKLAFRRHATSKIAKVDDLFKIATLGFRGEALASIASVAMVEAISKSTDSDEAFVLKYDAGRETTFEPAAWSAGTQITIKNLFFNVPARLKFLKGKRTELNHILDIFKPLALSHPDLQFKMTSDQKVLLDCKPGQQAERIVQIFGREYENKIVPVENTRGQIKVTGHIGNLDLVRVARGEQYLFVNGRPVTDRLLNNAVYGAYRSLIQRGEFPFFVLMVELPPAEVDVNVHPTKSEVKFKDEWRVYHILKETVETGLHETMKMVPGLHDRPRAQSFFSRPTPAPFSPDQTPQGHYQDQNPNQASLYGGGQSRTEPAQFPERSPEDSELLRKAREFSQVLQRTPETVSRGPERIAGGFIWQVHNKYILSQINSGIAIIDQHVAHERILFEEAMHQLDTRSGHSQTLLFPQTVEFPPDDYNTLLEILPDLNKLGFQIREFGPRTLLIEAVPVDMRGGAEGDVLREIVDYYRSNREFDYSPGKRLSASYACKAAVKAGDPLTEEEMRTLVDRLFATQHPFYCPHGRPIIIQLTIDELDKRFERH